MDLLTLQPGRSIYFVHDDKDGKEKTLKTNSDRQELFVQPAGLKQFRNQVNQRQVIFQFNP